MPENNMLTELVVAMNRQPQVYALLLGSGISRPARIPTGWEITLELAENLARATPEYKDLQTADIPAWYERTYDHALDYGHVLQQIGGRHDERRNLLHRFIERAENEPDATVKRPTKAHRAIAELIRENYVKVILTTNFDRLLEQALQEQGVQPSVIAHADALRGALPIVHDRCVIAKLHGDYKDGRILNTETELATYAPNWNTFLDRVIDEFGLIVAGWSSDYDPALRAALERAPNRRFSTYWLSPNDPSDLAQGLINHRRARLIRMYADECFEGLRDGVFTLRDQRVNHQQDMQLQLAQTKRFLTEGTTGTIKLTDLVLGEARRVTEKLDTDLTIAPQDTTQLQPEQKQAGIERLEALIEPLARMVALIVRFAPLNTTVLKRVLNLFARPAVSLAEANSTIDGESWRLYPFALLLHTVFIVATERAETDESALLFLKDVSTWEFLPRHNTPNLNAKGLLRGLEDAYKARPLFRALSNSHYPNGALFDRMYQTLNKWLREHFDDIEFARVFTQGEFVLALFHRYTINLTNVTPKISLSGRLQYKEDAVRHVTALLRQPHWVKRQTERNEACDLFPPLTFANVLTAYFSGWMGDNDLLAMYRESLAPLGYALEETPPRGEP